MDTTGDGVTGSWLTFVPPLKYIQSRFDTDSGMDFLRNYWGISVIGSVLYVALVFGGQKVMEKREPWSLRRPLILWNGGLAIFSVFGALSFVPSLIRGLYLHGFTYTICDARSIENTHLTLWGFLFILSKLFEFGDTFFIVMRKKPLLFLHWYHHITVCVYSFYICSGVSTNIASWFGSMNYVVHCVMYSYYCLRAAGFYISSRIALLITLMQLSQMFVGIFINVSSYNLYLEGRECGMKPKYFYFGMCIYGSYALLFLHLFITRYVTVPSKKKRE